MSSFRVKSHYYFYVSFNSKNGQPNLEIVKETT